MTASSATASDTALPPPTAGNPAPAIQTSDAGQAPVVFAEGLSKRYKIYPNPNGRLVEWATLGRAKRHSDFWALKDISLSVRRGECLGIVGENGSGKSTLLKLITGTLEPTEGRAGVHGRVLALLELGTGLNRQLTGAQNIKLAAQLLGLEDSYVAERAGAIAEFAGLGDFLDRPIKTYSSGMLARLSFSLFVFLEPDVLIVDEALSVGDAAFQRRCYRRMEEMIRNDNRAVIIVSHDLNAITKFCTSAIWLDKGKMQMRGQPVEVVEAYLKHVLGKAAEPIGPAGSAAKPASGTPKKAPPAEIPQKSLLPRTTAAVLYPAVDAELLGVWLEDANHTPVRTVRLGQPFFICYAVQFAAEALEVVFGTRIATIRGDFLVGSNSDMCKLPARDYQAGQTQIVRWPVRAGLNTGDYFITCGISTGRGTKNFLIREVDAYHLAVVGSSTSGGLCHLTDSPILSEPAK